MLAPPAAAVRAVQPAVVRPAPLRREHHASATCRDRSMSLRHRAQLACGVGFRRASSWHHRPFQHALYRAAPPPWRSCRCPPEYERRNPHLIAGLEPGALRQFDQPVALALAQVIDDLVGDACRPDTVHDQADDTDAPAGGVPLRLDGAETITRKERGRISILRPCEIRCSRSRGKYVS